MINPSKLMRAVAPGVYIGLNPNILPPDTQNDIKQQYEQQRQKIQRLSALGGVVGGLVSGGNPLGVGLGSVLGNLVGQVSANRNIGYKVNPLSSLLYGLVSGGLANLTSPYLSALISPVLLNSYNIGRDKYAL